MSSTDTDQASEKLDVLIKEYHFEVGLNDFEVESGKKAILALIRTEKLKLLDRLSNHQEDLFWWTGAEYEKTKAVDMRAIATEREQLDKLEEKL